MCDGARAALAVLEAALNEEILVLEGFLDAASDAVHRGNSLDRVIAGSRLAGEHDGIRTIEDGVADIGDLSARRARVALHGVEHLRSDDDRLASLVALADDLFLDQRNVLGRNLNAEVTASDHDAVGDFENRIEVLDAFEVLDLRHDLHVAIVLLDELADGQDVLRTLDKGSSDEIEVLLAAEDDVLRILLRDRRQAEGYARSSDALLRAHLAAVLDRRDDVLAADLIDLECYEAIREEQRVTRLDFRVEALVVDGDMRLIARDVLIRQRELIALLEHDLAVLELAEAHLRSLRIENQGNDLAGLLGSLAHHVDAVEVLCVVTMGEVKACTVHAVCNQCIDYARSLRSRTLRADNFRLL